MLVSLPFNMRGSVAATDVSDHMTRQLETEAERLVTEEVRSNGVWHHPKCCGENFCGSRWRKNLEILESSLPQWFPIMPYLIIAGKLAKISSCMVLLNLHLLGVLYLAHRGVRKISPPPLSIDCSMLVSCSRATCWVWREGQGSVSRQTLGWSTLTSHIGTSNQEW